MYIQAKSQPRPALGGIIETLKPRSRRRVAFISMKQLRFLFSFAPPPALRGGGKAGEKKNRTAGASQGFPLPLERNENGN